MNKINLLILDDKENNLISLKALLQGIDDINIICSTNPNEALKICWKMDISIALVDVQMPDINGFEFVSILKSNSTTSQILTVMVTAISKEEKYLIKGLQSGAIDYLYKPLNPEITIAKVMSLINQVKIRKEIIEKNIELEESRRNLLKAKKEAEEGKQSKEIFLANMSHEIRTPINGILGIVHMLKHSPLNDEQQAWLNRLDSASNSLLLIINDILDISKIDSGMMKIEMEDFSLREFLVEIEKLFSIRAASQDLEFEVITKETLPQYIHFDSLRLRQILTNFISNSLKFTEKGKISLIVTNEPIENNKHTLKFSVKDTGIGIKQEALKKIFLAFEQGDEGITKKYGGTGLGLAIVKRLADLLNGIVYAKSIFEKGSEFTFEVDVKEVKPSIREITTNIPYNQLSSLKGINVLVAEDNELNSFMLAHMLTTWKCQVDIVKNGQEALNLLQKKDYDIILMDTHMPTMSGFEAIKKIRTHSNKDKRETPIITISASVLENEQKAAFTAGADDVIGKPFDPPDLHTKIRKTRLSKKN